ncbi:hypothetical protein KI387_002931, partial [Taxus chinensis]
MRLDGRLEDEEGKSTLRAEHVESLEIEAPVVMVLIEKEEKKIYEMVDLPIDQ